MEKTVPELMAAISPEEWAQVPDRVLKLIEELERRMDKIEQEMAAVRTENELLKEQLARTSANSSVPPSKNPQSFKPNGTTVYVYDSNDRLSSETLNNQTTIYTYDANGNTLSRSKSTTDRATYAWDDRNRMVEAIVTDTMGTHQTTYRYNAEGIRVAMIANGQEIRYLIDSNRPYAQVLEEYTPDNIVRASYVYGWDLISQTRGSQQSFYERDGLGSTRALTSADGIVTDRFNYDAFGNQIGRMGDTITPYQFAGEQFDPNVGQYYLRARYYNTSSGRFTRMDTFEGNLSVPLTLHKYIYANADPVNGTDPTGLFTITEETEAALGRDILAAQGTVSVTTTTTISAQTFPAAVTAQAPAIANVARAPISIGGRIAVDVARATMNLLVRTVSTIDIVTLPGFPTLLWGSELPETTLHTFESITGTSTNFKDGSGIASPFLGRIPSPGWGRTWLDSVLPTQTGQVRDEYPYNSTYPGGPFFYELHQVAVKYVPAYEQSGSNPITGARGQGNKINSFYSNSGARVVANDPLLMWFGVFVTPSNSFYIDRNRVVRSFPFP